MVVVEARRCCVPACVDGLMEEGVDVDVDEGEEVVGWR